MHCLIIQGQKLLPVTNECNKTIGISILRLKFCFEDLVEDTIAYWCALVEYHNLVNIHKSLLHQPINQSWFTMWHCMHDNLYCDRVNVISDTAIEWYCETKYKLTQPVSPSGCKVILSNVGHPLLLTNSQLSFMYLVFCTNDSSW